MGFDVHLPANRMARHNGLWPNRLPIDDLDNAVRATPDAVAFAGHNSALGQDVRLT
jgi:hypothetical protein